MKIHPAIAGTLRLNTRLRRAFSLAEVTIALAIAAGGFVSLLGMIPQGLEMSRKSSAMSAKTRMVDIIAGQLATMPWQNLNWTGHATSTTGVRKYFDDQSIELTDTDLNNGAMLSYIASVYLPDPAGTTLAVKLPAGSSSTASTKETYARRALVYIAETTDKDFTFPLPTEELPRNVTYQALILPEMGIPAAQ
jgi:uncharacterized protein (TIGR02598 family)